MVLPSQLLRTGSTNSRTRNLAKSEFNSFLWLLSCLGDIQRQFVRASNESLLWLIRNLQPAGLSLALSRLSQSISVIPTMLLARDAKL